MINVNILSNAEIVAILKEDEPTLEQVHITKRGQYNPSNNTMRIEYTHGDHQDKQVASCSVYAEDSEVVLIGW